MIDIAPIVMRQVVVAGDRLCRAGKQNPVIGQAPVPSPASSRSCSFEIAVGEEEIVGEPPY